MCYTNRQIDNRMRKLQELEAAKKELENQISAIKEDIQTDMADMEIRETDHFIIRWSTVVTNRFDSKRFKEKHPEMYKDYLKPSQSRRFTYRTA